MRKRGVVAMVMAIVAVALASLLDALQEMGDIWFELAISITRRKYSFI